MKFVMPLIATVALAACGNPAEDTDEVVTDDVAVSQPAPVDASAAGVYEITMPDGTVQTETVSADGTYETVANGEVVETGTWRTEGEQMCEDPEGPEPEQCYTGSEPGADGSFTVDTPEGTMTIRKVA